ncbi:c-type cytochrome [Persephonella sp.]
MRVLYITLFSFVVFASSTVYGADKEKAYSLFKKYGCEGCHADYGIIAGPSFSSVKEKYIKEFNNDIEATKNYLRETIRKGSSGKWYKFLDMKMPSHPQIQPDELEIIVEWIVSLPVKKEGDKK